MRACNCCRPVYLESNICECSGNFNLYFHGYSENENLARICFFFANFVVVVYLKGKRS